MKEAKYFRVDSKRTLVDKVMDECYHCEKDYVEVKTESKQTEGYPSPNKYEIRYFFKTHVESKGYEFREEVIPDDQSIDSLVEDNLRWFSNQLKEKDYPSEVVGLTLKVHTFKKMKRNLPWEN